MVGVLAQTCQKRAHRFPAEMGIGKLGQRLSMQLWKGSIRVSDGQQEKPHCYAEAALKILKKKRPVLR